MTEGAVLFTALFCCPVKLLQVFECVWIQPLVLTPSRVIILALIEFGVRSDAQYGDVQHEPGSASFF